MSAGITSVFQVYHKLSWGVFAAFSMRVAAALMSSGFWANGYSVFFDFAQSTTAGRFRSPFAFRYIRHFLLSDKGKSD